MDDIGQRRPIQRAELLFIRIHMKLSKELSIRKAHHIKAVCQSPV
jgi:hypothetical protein